MKNLSIYIAHQITGLTFEQVLAYYMPMVHRLKVLGYTTFNPVTLYIDGVDKDAVCAAANLKGPLINNHALFERDKWMVSKADVILADFTGADRISIGACMELAIANVLGKHIVVIMAPDNPHYHGFVLEASSCTFPTIDEALVYLENINS